jgi:hypothetical protein
LNAVKMPREISPSKKVSPMKFTVPLDVPVCSE